MHHELVFLTNSYKATLEQDTDFYFCWKTIAVEDLYDVVLVHSDEETTYMEEYVPLALINCIKAYSEP
ncbi:hypothetical protein RchiOBHm_Chr7g0234831 [Rosa chinensis]|uniref:Uncharacterized protein n=1 Tax=Rosa chinensis TaxID=74649 RepID=A0A2P6PGI4_ROSCH|nr:hypothetical protein RchiOBHm_Chr7g0234831 [Rosa chinensis]